MPSDKDIVEEARSLWVEMVRQNGGRLMSDAVAIERLSLFLNRRSALSAPLEFFVDVDSLLSWITHRGWQITTEDDKQTCKRLAAQARKIYENPDKELIAEETVKAELERLFPEIEHASYDVLKQRLEIHLPGYWIKYFRGPGLRGAMAQVRAWHKAQELNTILPSEQQ